MMRRLRGERGSALVETALVVLFLQFLGLGMVDLAYGFTSYIGLTNAAREGARWISLHGENPSAGIAYAESQMAELGLKGEYQITLGDENEGPKEIYMPGDMVTVNINYMHPTLFGAAPPLLFGSGPGLTRVEFNVKASMRVIYEPEINLIDRGS